MENRLATPSDPQFKFYLYDDNGQLVQENLSLHDIQYLLLVQTQSGLRNLGWILNHQTQVALVIHVVFLISSNLKALYYN